MTHVEKAERSEFSQGNRQFREAVVAEIQHFQLSEAGNLV